MSDLKFGVEMEFMVPPKYLGQEFHGLLKYFGSQKKLDFRTRYNECRTKYWHVHHDGSLYDSVWEDDREIRTKQPDPMEGAEISSPILQGRKGFNELKKVCNLLKSNGCTVNRTCGLHVHIDTSNFTQEEKFAIIARYTHLSKAIDNLVSENRREDNNRYTQNHPMNGYVVDFYFRYIKNEAYWDYSSHNHKIEISTRWPTVEFRHHQGSIDYDEIASWVNFCMNFTNQSVKMYRKFARNNPDKEDIYLNRLKDNNPFVGLSSYKKNKLLTLKQLAA